MRQRRRLLSLLSGLVLVFSACGPGGEDTPDAEPAEVLFPEPVGAPTDVADGRLTCLGNNGPATPGGNTIELTGYVRTLADPVAASLTPTATIEAFTATGTPLEMGFSDPSKDGRVAVTVGINDVGFDGHVLVTAAGYLDYSFKTNRAVAATEANGWTWLVTQADVDQWGLDLSVTVDAARGIVVGSVHDCDNFGVGFSVVQVNGATDGVFYVNGFNPAAGDTFTSASGRFVVPNVAVGPVTIKAFARLTSGGPLTLISTVQTEAVAGRISAIAMQLR